MQATRAREHRTDESRLTAPAVSGRTHRVVPGEARSFLLLTAEAAPSSPGARRPARVQRFATEQEARAAFIAARLSSCPRIERAELVAHLCGGSVRTLSWFGPEIGKAGARPTAALVPTSAPVDGRRRRPRFVSRFFHGRR